MKLTAKQKEEIRRLTQKANRRITAFHKAYAKEGLTIAPYEPTGGIQTKAQWETKKYPLSRSTRFTSIEEYRKRLKFLRSFDREVERPNLTQYTRAQQGKTVQAVETSLGGISLDLRTRIENMTAGELAKFWDKFEIESRRLGLQYSSNAAMSNAIEYFEEDVKGLENRVKG